MMSKCCRPHSCVLKYACSNVAAVLQRFLTDLQKRKRQPDDLEWREAHIDEYQLLSLTWGKCRPDPNDKMSAFWEFLRLREQDVLTVCRALLAKRWTSASMKKVGSVHSADVSQSVKRRVSSSSRECGDGSVVSLAPAVLPGSRNWVFTPFNRLECGRESLAQQGVPVELYADLLSQFDDSLLQDMSGNMMSVGVPMAVCLAAVFAPSWSGGQEASATSQDTQSALAALFQTRNRARS